MNPRLCSTQHEIDSRDRDTEYLKPCPHPESLLLAGMALLVSAKLHRLSSFLIKPFLQALRSVRRL